MTNRLQLLRAFCLLLKQKFTQANQNEQNQRFIVVLVYCFHRSNNCNKSEIMTNERKMYVSHAYTLQLLTSHARNSNVVFRTARVEAINFKYINLEFIDQHATHRRHTTVHDTLFMSVDFGCNPVCSPRPEYFGCVTKLIEIRGVSGQSDSLCNNYVCFVVSFPY